MRYIVNAFSMNMLPLPPLGQRKKFTIEVENLELNQFCREIDRDSLPFTESPVCAVGHRSTVEIINRLCGTNFIYGYNCDRRDIKLFGDENTFIIIQIAYRLSEGEIIDTDTLMHMVKNRNIVFLKVVVRE